MTPFNEWRELSSECPKTSSVCSDARFSLKFGFMQLNCYVDLIHKESSLHPILVFKLWLSNICQDTFLLITNVSTAVWRGEGQCFVLVLRDNTSSLIGQARPCVYRPPCTIFFLVCKIARDILNKHDRLHKRHSFGGMPFEYRSLLLEIDSHRYRVGEPYLVCMMTALLPSGGFGKLRLRV